MIKVRIETSGVLKRLIETKSLYFRLAIIQFANWLKNQVVNDQVIAEVGRSFHRYYDEYEEANRQIEFLYAEARNLSSKSKADPENHELYVQFKNKMGAYNEARKRADSLWNDPKTKSLYEKANLLTWLKNKENIKVLS